MYNYLGSCLSLAGESRLREPCLKKRCGTAAWNCCRIIYPVSLNLLLARSLSVLPSWELPSNSFTKESRNNLLSLRTRSVVTQTHVIPDSWVSAQTPFIVGRMWNIWPSAGSFSCASLHLPSSHLNCFSWGNSMLIRGPAERCSSWPRYSPPYPGTDSVESGFVMSSHHISLQADSKTAPCCLTT